MDLTATFAGRRSATRVPFRTVQVRDYRGGSVAASKYRAIGPQILHEPLHIGTAGF